MTSLTHPLSWQAELANPIHVAPLSVVAHLLPHALREEWDTVTVQWLSLCKATCQTQSSLVEHSSRPEVGGKWNALYCCFQINYLHNHRSISLSFFTDNLPFYILCVCIKFKGHEIGVWVYPLKIYILVWHSHWYLAMQSLSSKVLGWKCHFNILFLCFYRCIESHWKDI